MELDIANMITSLATLVAAVIPLITTLVIANYRERKSTHDKTVAWIESLRVEVDHELNTVAELSDTLASETSLFIKRFCEDLFRLSKQEIIFCPRIVKILPEITKLAVDLRHTNNVLNRFEIQINNILVEGSIPVDLSREQRVAIIRRKQVIEVCVGEVHGNLLNLKNILEKEFAFLNRNPPKILPIRTV